MNLNFSDDEPIINWGEEYLLNKEDALNRLLLVVPKFIGTASTEMLNAYINIVADDNELVHPKYIKGFMVDLSRWQPEDKHSLGIRIILPPILLNDRPLLNRVFDVITKVLLSSGNISAVGCGQNIIKFTLKV